MLIRSVKKMKSPITRCALILPILCFCLGVLHASVMPISSRGWLGMNGLISIFYSILAASLVAVIFSAWAFGRKEKDAGRTLIFSIPSLFFMLWLGAFITNDSFKKKKFERESELYVKTCAEIKSNPTILRSTNWLNVSAPEDRAFGDSLNFGWGPYSEDDIIYIYDNYPNFRILLFRHPECPAYLLEKNFEEAWALFKSGESYRMLDFICSNENTPQKLLEKVEAESVAAHKTLNKLRRKKLQNNTQ